MATERELAIVVSAQDNASAKLVSLGNKIQASFAKVSKAAGIVGASIAGIGALSIKNFVEAERSARQLEHAVVDVSKGTKEQVGAILEVSNALQKKAGIDGDALAMGAAQLSTFGLQSESVLHLTKSLADLTVNQAGVTAGADDYVSSANIMAKALQGQFGQLEKSGIRFTTAQQQMIQFGSETEKVAALTEGLNQNLRETTDTVGLSAEGAFAILRQSVGDISEAIGKALLPALVSIVTQITPIVQKFTDWASTHEELVVAITGVALAIAGLLASLGPIGTAINMVGLALANWPIALVVAGIIAIGVAVVVFRDKVMELYAKLQESGAIDTIKNALSSLKDKLLELWEQFKQTGILEAFQNALLLVWQALTESLWPAIQQIWIALQPWLPLLGDLARLFGTVLIGAILFLVTTFAVFVEAIGGVLKKVAEFVTQLTGFLKPGIDGARQGIQDMINVVKSMIDWFNTAISTIGKVISKIGDLAKSAAGGVIGGLIGKITGGSTKARALGGPVTRGETYMVGENGPELFTAPSGGSIVPNGRVGGGASVAVYNTLSIGSVSSELDVKRMAKVLGDSILGDLKQQLGI